jgi:hypothetical protein
MTASRSWVHAHSAEILVRTPAVAFWRKGDVFGRGGRPRRRPGAGRSLERGALTEPLAHLGGDQPIPAAADAAAGEVAVQLVGHRVGVPPLGIRPGER